MGLVVRCRITRFVDDLSADLVEESSRPLLKAFLESIGADSVSSSSNPVTLSSSQAIIDYSQAVAHLGRAKGASRGISFTPIGQEAKAREWTLALHAGPLPVLELLTDEGNGCLGNRDRDSELLAASGAHVLSIEGRDYLGNAAYVYLFLKRQRLFPYSKGESTTEAISAGRQMRDLCLNLQPDGITDHPTHHNFGWWGGKRRRFLKEFDSRLLAQSNRTLIEQTLQTMGVDLDQWLETDAARS